MTLDVARFQTLLTKLRGLVYTLEVKLFFYILALLYFCEKSPAEAPKSEFIKEKAPFPGYFYRPIKEGPAPAIIFLHGSDGGNGNFWTRTKKTGEEALTPRAARRHAKKGYITFALCYFDCRHHKGYENYPPDELVKVDIKEVVGRAIRWLRKSKYVGGEKVLLFGGSRGAELALLYASLEKVDLPDAIVALSPSDYVVRQFSRETADQILAGKKDHWPKKPAWTFGREIPKIDEPIHIQKFSAPLYVDYFSIDPVWIKKKNVDSMAARYERKVLKMDFKKGQKHEPFFKRITENHTNITFIKFDFEGHVFPTRETEKEAFLLQVKALEWFLGKYLK